MVKLKAPIAFPCFFALSTLLNEPSEQSDSLRYYVRKMLPVIVVTVVAFIIYSVVSSLFKQTVPPSTVEFCKNYQQSLITWGKLPLDVHILHIGKQWVLHLLGMSYPGEWFYGLTLVAVAYLSYMALMKRNVAICIKFLNVAIICILYVAPFVAIVALGEDQGPRLHMFEPFACAILWCLALQRWNGLLKKQYSGVVVCAFGCFLALKAMYVVSDMANTQNRYFEENVRIAGEIKTLALQTNVPEGCVASELPIYVSGAYHGDDARLDKYLSCVSGISTPSFYTLVRIPNLYHISNSGLSKEQIEHEFETMPLYPHPGSCRYVDGKIIVKCSKDWQAK